MDTRLTLLVFTVTIDLISGKRAYIDFTDPSIFQSASCDIRNTFDVIVRTDENIVTLQLEKNPDVCENVPVYVTRRDVNDVVHVVRDPVLDIQDIAEYQDIGKLTSVEISCKHGDENSTHFQLNGIIALPDGEVYETALIKRTKRSIHPRLPGDLYELIPEEDVEIELDKALFDTHDEIDPPEMKQTVPADRPRHKRETQSIYVDVVTIIDYYVYERWYNRSSVVDSVLRATETKQNLRRHFAHLFNGINLRFHSASESYNMRLVGYVIEDVEPGEYFTSVQEEQELNGTNIDGDKLLSSMRNWTNHVDGFPESDHIMMWTAYDLYWLREGVYGNLLGIAFWGTICKFHNSSVSLVEYGDRMIVDMLVAAHEMGHAMAAHHDGEKGNECLKDDSYIMRAGVLKSHFLEHNNQYLFSSCSAEYFRIHVDGLLTTGSSNDTTCLLEQLSTASVTNISGEMPGQLYNPDTQCRMLYGEESYFCRGFLDATTIDTICKRMYCYDKEGAGRCVYMNAAEGTSCGTKKWCIAGVCEYSDDAPDKRANCLFGDDPGTVFSTLTCDEFIPANKDHYCYHKAFNLLCCTKCIGYETTDTECLYGDNRWNTTCQASQCAPRSDTNYVDLCCDTCRDFRTTTMSTTTSTTTPTTTSTTTTTPTTTPTTSPTTTATTQTTSRTTTPTTSPTTTTQTTTSPTTTETTSTTTTPSTTTSDSAISTCIDNTAYEASVGSSCTATVSADPSSCYSQTFNNNCCISCRAHRTTRNGCEYGNKNTTFCAGKRGPSCCGHGDTCCSTCAVADALCSGGRRKGQDVEALTVLLTAYFLLNFLLTRLDAW